MLLKPSRKDDRLARRLQRLLAAWEGGETGRGQCQVLLLLAVGRSESAAARETRRSASSVRRIYADFRRMGEEAFLARASASTGGRPRKIQSRQMEDAYRAVLLDGTQPRVSLATKMAAILHVSPMTVRRAVRNPEFEIIRMRVLADLLPPPLSGSK